jgi:hypothetical protein
MADQSDLVEQRFIYAGRRLSQKKLVYCWLSEGDESIDSNLRLFPKAKGSVIGGIYTIKVSADSYVPASVTYTGDRADRTVAVAFEATDRADGVSHSTVTLERNDARTSEIKELCAPLRELVGKQVGWSSRAALLAYITSEISRS